MSVEERLEALEKRVLAAEDQLEIIRLINAYGPLVDTDTREAAAETWAKDGFYDLAVHGRATGHEQIAEMYGQSIHQGLVRDGSAHVMSTPHITLMGDRAEAVGYSIVIRKYEGGWFIYRTSANHWVFTRTAEGWRIAERYNHLIDSSEASHEILRRIKR